LSHLDAGCQKLYENVPPVIRNRLKWFWVDMDEFFQAGTKNIVKIPYLNLKVPGEHLRLDANLAYVASEIVGISEKERITGLE
jgi:hypothetical protein